MFFRFGPGHLKRRGTMSRLRRAALFGQPLIIDLGFEEYMTRDETILTAKQIKKTYNFNRESDTEPFNLWLVNYRPDSLMGDSLQTVLPDFSDNPNYMLHKTSEHYLNLDYPRRKLIYVTSHCRDEMHEYDSSAIYILGGCVSRTGRTKTLIADRAVRDGVKMVKFPLERYLAWKYGSKSLNINVMVAILSDLKHGKSMQQALTDRVPRRHLRNEEDADQEVERIASKYKKITFDLRSFVRKL